MILPGLKNGSCSSKFSGFEVLQDGLMYQRPTPNMTQMYSGGSLIQNARLYWPVAEAGQYMYPLRKIMHYVKKNGKQSMRISVWFSGMIQMSHLCSNHLRQTTSV